MGRLPPFRFSADHLGHVPVWLWTVTEERWWGADNAAYFGEWVSLQIVTVLVMMGGGEWLEMTQILLTALNQTIKYVSLNWVTEHRCVFLISAPYTLNGCLLLQVAVSAFTSGSFLCRLFCHFSLMPSSCERKGSWMKQTLHFYVYFIPFSSFFFNFF